MAAAQKRMGSGWVGAPSCHFMRPKGVFESFVVSFLNTQRGTETDAETCPFPFRRPEGFFAVDVLGSATQHLRAEAGQLGFPGLHFSP